MNYTVHLTKQAQKELPRLRAAKLYDNALELLHLIEQDPYAPYPRFEHLGGEMTGYIARRINLKHRLVYEVLEASREVIVVSVWSHYERI